MRDRGMQAKCQYMEQVLLVPSNGNMHCAGSVAAFCLISALQGHPPQHQPSEACILKATKASEESKDLHQFPATTSHSNKKDKGLCQALQASAVMNLSICNATMTPFNAGCLKTLDPGKALR